MADEALRIEVLAVVFPGAPSLAIAGTTIDASRKSPDKRHLVAFPDALAAEKMYRVIGPPMNPIERCAAAGAAAQAEREVRFRLYPWPGRSLTSRDQTWIAVLQYAFAGAVPQPMCTSIGLLARVTRIQGALSIAEQFLLSGEKHHAIQNIAFSDLTGDGTDELIVESDVGGAEYEGSEIHIFNLNQGRFEELLVHASRMFATVMGEELYKQELDVKRSFQTRGKQFCFHRTVYGEEGKWYPTPHVTQPCYPSGRGVDADANAQRATQLTK